MTNPDADAETTFLEFATARMNATFQLSWWMEQGQVQSQEPAKHLAWLMGYGDYFQFTKDMTAADLETLRRLCGPHGWAIYKALLARRSA